MNFLLQQNFLYHTLPFYVREVWSRVCMVVKGVFGTGHWCMYMYSNSLHCCNIQLEWAGMLVSSHSINTNHILPLSLSCQPVIMYICTCTYVCMYSCLCGSVIYIHQWPVPKTPGYHFTEVVDNAHSEMVPPLQFGSYTTVVLCYGELAWGTFIPKYQSTLLIPDSMDKFHFSFRTLQRV